MNHAGRRRLQHKSTQCSEAALGSGFSSGSGLRLCTTWALFAMLSIGAAQPAAQVPLQPQTQQAQTVAAPREQVGTNQLATKRLGTEANDIRLQGRELVGSLHGETIWTFPLPPELGVLRGPLRQGEVTYVGIGPAVLAFDMGGNVLARYDLSAPVLTLDGSGGLIRATVAGDDYRETFTLIPPENGGGTRERVVFAPEPAVTLWTVQAADLVPASEVSNRWQQNDLNPFLGLRAAGQARAAGQPEQEAKALQRLMNAPQPFPVWVKLAARLEAAGYPQQAELALERARADAAARGYDPAIRVDRTALAAYGNPTGYVSTLLDQGRLTRAEVWLRHLRALHPRMEGGETLYLRFAGELDKQGRAGEAAEWRRFVDSLRVGTLYHGGATGLRALSHASGLLAFSLALSLVLAVWATARRARSAQQADLLALRSRKRSWRSAPVQHLRYSVLSYVGAGERLVLLGLSLSLVLSLSGGLWASRTAQLLAAPALNIGTYGGAWSESGLARLPLRSGPDAALLRGLSVQLSGDLSRARVSYQAAHSLGCARNNLGTISALRSDQPSADAFFRSALSVQPDLGAAAYNLKFPVLTLGSDFQALYRGGEPRLCYPDDRSLIRALGGSVGDLWRAQWAQAGLQLREITSLAARGKLHPWALLWLAEAVAVAAIVLTLLPVRVPRKQSTPRPVASKVSADTLHSSSPLPLPSPSPERDLLAWLLPGSGLLEWVWGGVLLLVFVAAALAWLTGWAMTQTAAGVPLPWPLTLWPADAWPTTLAGLSGSLWPPALLLFVWLTNAAYLWWLRLKRKSSRTAK